MTLRGTGIFAAGVFFGTMLTVNAEARADEMTDYFVASDVGPTVCEYFETGVTPGSVLRLGEIMMEEAQMTPEQAGVFIRDAVDVYCPEYASQLVDVASDWQSGEAKYKRLV